MSDIYWSADIGLSIDYKSLQCQRPQQVKQEKPWLGASLPGSFIPHWPWYQQAVLLNFNPDINTMLAESNQCDREKE